MGVVLPDNFDLRKLRNDAEREVVTAFRDRLSDGWYVIPSLGIHATYDYELDVVLIHKDYGIIDIEVKGHRVHLDGGVWKDHQGALDPQPMDQARNNAYKLRRLLRDRFPGELDFLAVHYGVALPNTRAIVGSLPPAYTASQILTGPDLLDPFEKIQAIVAEGQIGPKLFTHHIESVVQVLFPDADFVWDEHAQSTRTKQRLEELSADQTRTLEHLDANRRVVVTGGAGTGKTRLASAWARRALSREERVLFVCFNEPLADEIAERLLEDDSLVTGAFYQVALHLEGMPHLEIPADLDDAHRKLFWDVTASGHLHANWPSIIDRFDTIIIDEAQDFSPAWIAQLAALLDPDGPRRMLMVADAGQDVFNRGFSLPSNDDGWTVCELTNNCRNSLEIAQLLRRFLGGSASPQSIPLGQGSGFHPVDSQNAEAALRHLLEREDLPASTAVIVWPTWKEKLRSSLGLGTWDDRRDRVICESVRRLKGTEFDTVILFDPDGEMDDQALYVAISRAVNRLEVIGPELLGRRIGLLVSE
jgi:hypothetical protein